MPNSSVIYMILNVRLAHGQQGVFSTGKSGLSLRFQVVGQIQQVGRESNSWGFLLVLFFFCFPMKVAGDHIHSRWGKSPALGP